MPVFLALLALLQNPWDLAKGAAGKATTQKLEQQIQPAIADRIAQEPVQLQDRHRRAGQGVRPEAAESGDRARQRQEAARFPPASRTSSSR